MNASIEDVINVFSEEDKEFNRRMVEAAGKVDGISRGDMRIGRLGGKVIRGSYEKVHCEEEYDFTSGMLERY